MAKLTYGHFYRDGEWDCDHAYELTDFEEMFPEYGHEGAEAVVDAVLGDDYLDYDQWLDQSDDQQLAASDLDPKIAYKNWAAGWRACAIKYTKHALEDWNKRRREDTEVWYLFDRDEQKSIIEQFTDQDDALDAMEELEAPPIGTTYNVALGDLNGPHETIAFKDHRGKVVAAAAFHKDIEAWRTRRKARGAAHRAARKNPARTPLNVAVVFDGLVKEGTPESIAIAQDLLLEAETTLFAVSGTSDTERVREFEIRDHVVRYYVRSSGLNYNYVACVDVLPVAARHHRANAYPVQMHDRYTNEYAAKHAALVLAWNIVKDIAAHGQSSDETERGRLDALHNAWIQWPFQNAHLSPPTPDALLEVPSDEMKSIPMRKNPPELSREKVKQRFAILVNKATPDDLSVAQDLLLEYGMTIYEASADRVIRGSKDEGHFRIHGYDVYYSIAETNATGMFKALVSVMNKSRRRFQRQSALAASQPSAVETAVVGAWNVVKSIASFMVPSGFDFGDELLFEELQRDPYLMSPDTRALPPTPAELLEVNRPMKSNPPFDDFKKTVRNMGGLVNGKIDLRDSHDEELELFVMNEYELFNAVRGQGATGVKAVVDQFFLYTSAQFEQLMEAVSVRAQDAGTFHDNPRMGDDIDDVIVSSTESNMELRRRLADAKAKVHAIKVHPKDLLSAEGRKLTKAQALVRSLEAKLEDHANLTAELGRHRQNPASNPQREKALEKYKEFWRLEPTKIGEFPSSFKIPARVHKLGRAVHVLYESGKVDPENLKKPRKPLSYIHDHGKFVDTHDTQGTADTKVPDFIINCDALVMLGQCLGFAWKDADGVQHDAEGTDPLPDLWCTPDGHALLVIQSRRKVLAITWGEGLKVEARGIVG